MKTLIGVMALSAVFILPGTASLAMDGNTTVTVVSPNSVPVDASAETRDQETMICHAARPLIGSRFSGPRICKTKRQWAMEKTAAQHDTEKLLDVGCRGGNGPNPSCGNQGRVLRVPGLNGPAL